MSKDDEKIMLYINVTWLKASLKFFVTVIVPYNIIMFILWKYTKLLSPSVGCTLSIWGTFAIAFIGSIVRRRKAANKE